MSPRKRNVILTGMPGAGKSAIGALVARKLQRNFVDTDLLLQQQSGQSIGDMVQKLGFDGFLKTEEAFLLSLDCTETVIATGGSAVYSHEAMAQLSRTGSVIYIEVPLQMLMMRVPDLHGRGIAVRPGMSYVDLYQERLTLYEQSSTATFAPSVLDIEDSADGIARLATRLEEPFRPVTAS